MNSSILCPDCNHIAYFNSYFNKYVCSNCNWMNNRDDYKVYPNIENDRLKELYTSLSKFVNNYDHLCGTLDCEHCKYHVDSNNPVCLFYSLYWELVEYFEDDVL